MRARDHIALNLAPVPVRLALACIFLWAGLGKVMGTMEVSGQQAATLANLGVALDRGAPGSGSNETSPEEDSPVEPEGQSAAPAGPLVVLATQDGSFSASDFDEPVETLKVYGLMLLMHSAADDSRFGPDGAQLDPIWPGWAGDAPWVGVLAWTAAITEIVFGFLILIGLGTRLGALNMCGVMFVAIWLTEIGPAIQSGQTTLGFLPAYEVFDVVAWRPLLFQLAVLAGAATLLMLGPGSISIDAMAFGKKPDPPEDEEEDEEEEE